jgi:integrase
MACIRKRRGKWVVDYRDGAGIRRWKTYETKREAEDFLDVERPKTRQWTQSAVDPGITVKDYAERWKVLIASTVKPRTLVSYTQNLTLHILPVFGAYKVQHLMRGQIKAFLANKLQAGKSKNTVRIMHATVRAMLKAAVDDGLIMSNPAEKLGRQLHLVVSKATRQEEIKAMTSEQRHAFLTKAAKVEPKYYPLFFALAGTGMRLGEGLALQWHDLSLIDCHVRVARALSARVIETPKAGHGRTVDISSVLSQVLVQHEVKQKAEKLRRGWAEMPLWVFWNDEGHPMDESKVRKAMTRVLKAAGLPPHFSPHCLRHTYASLLLQQGVSPAYVQRQLGHASIQLTVDTYGKWLPMENHGAVDRLDAVATEPSGSRMVATGGKTEEKASEVLDKFGGPCRGRTYGPLIKSQLLYQLS